jgi:hypothetical protein
LAAIQSAAAVLGLVSECGQGIGCGFGCGIELGGGMVAQHPIDEPHQAQGIAGRERQVGRLAPEAGGLERLQVR